MNQIIVYALTGMATGLVTGLLGGGSGPILIPILAMLLTYQSSSTTLVMHMAVGTALGIALLAMITSLFSHHKNLEKIKGITFALLPGGILGSIVGTLLATCLSGAVFKLLFGIVVLFIALYTFLNRPTSTNEIHFSAHKKWKLFFISIPLGSIATCFGIGMGPLCIPLLKKYGFTMAQAIAAATLVGLILVIFATVGFILLGYYHGNLLPYSIGYIYLPMLIGIGIPTIIFAHMGAKLTHRFSQSTLKIIFITFLFVIGIKMIFF